MIPGAADDERNRAMLRDGLRQALERTTIARFHAVLFGLGGLLLFGTLLLQGDPERETAEMAAVGGVAVASAGALLLADRRIALWALRVSPAFATVLVALVVYLAGPTASSAYGMYMIWVVLGAALFLSVRVVLAHGAFAVAAFVAALEVGELEGARTGLLVAVMTGTVVAIALVVGGIAGQLRDIIWRLESAARTDPLTGLLNRRALTEEFERELARAVRAEQPVGIVVLDLDGFKRFNDRHGHPAGDVALRRLGQVLQQTTRAIDHVARLGGEEFAVLAPESETAGALAMAERVRRAIEIEFSGGDDLTASFGVASFPANGLTHQELLGAADRALYEAKARGRNRAVASKAAPAANPPRNRRSA